MEPAYFKVGQTIATPHGKGRVIDATPHRLHPEDDPSVWLYGVEFDPSLGVSVSNQLPFLSLNCLRRTSKRRQPRPITTMATEPIQESTQATPTDDGSGVAAAAICSACSICGEPSAHDLAHCPASQSAEETRVELLRVRSFLRRVSKQRDPHSYGSNEPTALSLEASRLLSWPNTYSRHQGDDNSNP